MNTFDFANEALRRDLAAYSHALRTIVESLPQAQALCDQALKEVRLAKALLAFASGPQITELGQIFYKLSNLWPYRERPYARTLGFEEEIAEAKGLRDEALRGVRMLARHGDALSSEVITCLTNIDRHLQEEQRLLEECHASIRPHAENMDMTRKRLDLLIAAVDARMPFSATQQSALKAYGAAADLLRDWENGVPLDDQGVAILDRCLDILSDAGTAFTAGLNPGR